MPKIRVAILGASGIGKFHAREFVKAGAEVVAILGASQESALQTSQTLREKFKVEARPYSNLDDLLKNEEVDAVSVCTPSSFHFENSIECLNSGVNVFSEKPVVQNSDFDNAKFAKELIEVAKNKGLIFTVNTQWPAIIPYLNPYVDLNDVSTFSMLMQPRDFGKDILLDQVPHMNSVLLHLIPNGEIENISFKNPSKGDIEVFFDFVDKEKICKVNYKFKYKESGTRDWSIEINGHSFNRVVDDNYNQSLVSSNEQIQIPDPLSISIQKFVGALSKSDEVLISSREIIRNIEIQDIIVKKYLK